MTETVAARRRRALCSIDRLLTLQCRVAERAGRMYEPEPFWAALAEVWRLMDERAAAVLKFDALAAIERHEAELDGRIPV